jgi:hypothetical protein
MVAVAILGLALLGLRGADAQNVKPKSLVGKYDAVTVFSTGERYEGTAEITLEKGKSVKITWQYGKRKDIGLGRLEGNKLTVTYQRAYVDTQGKAEYTVEKGGKLSGTFEDTKGKSGTEVLTPK